VLSRTKANLGSLALPEQYHTSVAGGAIFRRVTIRSKPLLLKTNYTKIKRIESIQSCIATAREGK